MLKSDIIKNEKAIVDVDTHYRVIQSNPIFKRFFPSGLNTSLVKITKLIEFDDASKFKKSLIDFRKGKKCNLVFNGKISNPRIAQSVVVKVSSKRKQNSKWSQEAVSLIFEEDHNLENSSDVDIISQFFLQQELDAAIRELSTSQMLISQKVDLLDIISRELNKIFPLAVGPVKSEIRKLILLIKSQNVFHDYWANLKVHFVKMHPSFFQDLRKRSKKITEKDLRHCAYLKIGLSVKETAQLLSIEPKSVEMARYRIKKKLKLKKSKKLVDFVRKL